MLLYRFYSFSSFVCLSTELLGISSLFVFRRARSCSTQPILIFWERIRELLNKCNGLGMPLLPKKVISSLVERLKDTVHSVSLGLDDDHDSRAEFMSNTLASASTCSTDFLDARTLGIVISEVIIMLERCQSLHGLSLEDLLDVRAEHWRLLATALFDSLWASNCRIHCIVTGHFSSFRIVIWNCMGVYLLQ